MYKSFKRVVVVALVIVLSAFNGTYVKAETVDDLRDLVGKPRASSAESRAEIKTFLSVYEQAKVKSELAGMLDGIEKKEKADSDRKLLELNAEKAKEKQRLLNLISNDEDVLDILSTVNTLDSIESKLEGVNRKPVSLLVDETVTENYADRYEYIQSLLDSIGNDYELGNMGRGLETPVEGIFTLKDAFGLYLDSNTNTEEVNNKGVRLLALKYGDTKVRSQWHGVIKEIKNGRITIGHGNSLETVYSKIKDTKVKVGDEVKQYDNLGNIDGESLYFSIKLDTYYIDPMMIYGAEGVEAYYDWVTSNPSRIIAVNDMSSFKNEVDLADEIEDKDANNNEVTTNDDGSINATLPDDYVAPYNGVLE